MLSKMQVCANRNVKRLYSLMKSSRINTGGIEGALQYSFFELTSDWGMTPARPLWILLGLIPGFALLYMIPVLRPSPGGALWRVWDKDRARKDQGQDDPEPLGARGYRAPLYGLFFSVLSALHIGWNELSIGSWIARLNPYEYTLVSLPSAARSVRRSWWPFRRAG